MFAFSTQKKFWLFTDEAEILKARFEANRRFVDKHGANLTVIFWLAIFCMLPIDANETQLYFRNIGREEK
jgi:hypothetical protein